MDAQKRERLAQKRARERNSQEKKLQYEREAMRRMGAPQWAVAIRVEQVLEE